LLDRRRLPRCVDAFRDRPPATRRRPALR
jgi:hypothetical protein